VSRLRACSWCQQRPVLNRGAKYCSRSCRQRAYEHRRLELSWVDELVLAARQTLTLAINLQTRAYARHDHQPHVQKETENAQSATQRT
jgi:uncharacterized paraquat-inducible protein A